jgi:WD40 repeat protein
VTAPNDATPQPDTPRAAETRPASRWGATFAVVVLAGVAGLVIWVCYALTGSELRQFVGHEGIVNAVAFTPDGRFALSAGEEKDRDWFSAFALGVGPIANVLGASHPGDNTVRVWDVATGELVQTFKRPVAPVKDVAVLPDGKTAVSADVQTLRVWDIASGKELSTVEGHMGALTCVAVHPDGKHVFLGSRNDRHFQLWPLDQQRVYIPRKAYRGHTGWVNSLSVSPDGRRVVSGGDKSVRLWDVETAQQLQVFLGHRDTVKSVALSPDGRRVVSASMDGTVRLWDAESGKELRRFTGHASWVLSVAFSPDGRRVATGSEGLVRDQKEKNLYEKYTLRVWDAETGAELLHFHAGEGAVRSVAFSPDGTRLLSGGDDRVVRLWRIPQ